MAAWVRSFERDIEYTEGLDGINWCDAKLPPRLHRCRPQTRGFMMALFVERCACGGGRVDQRGPWVWKNERRRKIGAR